MPVNNNRTDQDGSQKQDVNRLGRAYAHAATRTQGRTLIAHLVYKLNLAHPSVYADFSVFSFLL